MKHSCSSVINKMKSLSYYCSFVALGDSYYLGLVLVAYIVPNGIDVRQMTDTSAKILIYTCLS